jgi:hypothetical protein
MKPDTPGIKISDQNFYWKPVTYKGVIKNYFPEFW